MVKTADQVVQLAFENGLKVSPAVEASLLPTPALGHIRNYDEPIENYLERRQDFLNGKTKGMPGVSLGVALRMEQQGIDLMPTPMSRDWKGDVAPHERNGVVQTDSVERAIFHSGEILLPTTTASDWKGANNSGSKTSSANGIATAVDNLPETSWGKFEPAIRRWEQVIGRRAPAPTKPDGKDGAHRLSSSFTEWMMGLPEDWICGHGLSRNDELKMAGNGVVPQQAELALRILLEGVEF